MRMWPSAGNHTAPRVAGGRRSAVTGMTAVESAIRASALRYAWPGSEAIIDLPALQLAAGEKLFVAGPSGSGKSTLLGLLGGVLAPSQGKLEVIGHALETLAPSQRDHFRADHVGFIFQMFNLVPYLPVLENVMLPTHFSKRRRERAGSASGRIRDEALRLLDALELTDSALHARTPGALSIGQQQRVAVARALIGAPELLIADEPTSALDEGTREKFLDLLFQECDRQATTLILVSHDPRLANAFDRQIALELRARDTNGQRQ